LRRGAARESDRRHHDDRPRPPVLLDQGVGEGAQDLPVARAPEHRRGGRRYQGRGLLGARQDPHRARSVAEGQVDVPARARDRAAESEAQRSAVVAAMTLATDFADAVNNGDLALAKKLHKRGANPNTQPESYTGPPIVLAVNAGHEDVARWLLG